MVREFRQEEQELFDGKKTALNREAGFKNHDGEHHWVITTKVALRDHDGRVTGLVGINRDITERKWAEEQLNHVNLDLARSQQELLSTYENLKRANEELKATQWRLIQAEKLESIGRLAAGVAHEVKNPLATILMGVEYLGEELRDRGEDVAMTLGQMEEAIRRADSIVRGLLDVAASGTLELLKVNVNGVLEQSLLLVRHELGGKQVHVVKQFAQDLHLVGMDRAKIEQVFINVFVNAIHAMTAGGQLRIISRLGTDERGRQALIVEVEDNGPGLPPEVLTRVFDPFYSTKPTGMGSGLGLAVARNIMDLHQGSIHIENRPEGGARVTLTFKT